MNTEVLSVWCKAALSTPNVRSLPYLSHASHSSSVLEILLALLGASMLVLFSAALGMSQPRSPIREAAEVISLAIILFCLGRVATISNGWMVILAVCIVPYLSVLRTTMMNAAHLSTRPFDNNIPVINRAPTAKEEIVFCMVYLGVQGIVWAATILAKGLHAIILGPEEPREADEEEISEF